MTNLKELSASELHQRILAATNELIAREVEEVEETEVIEIEHEGLTLRKVEREAREGDYIRPLMHHSGSALKVRNIYGPVNEKLFVEDRFNDVNKDEYPVYVRGFNRTPDTVEVFEVVDERKNFKTEKRNAQVGEKVLITNPRECSDGVKGEIFTVSKASIAHLGNIDVEEIRPHGAWAFIPDEYEVLVSGEHDEYETCDSCNKTLDKFKNEDIYIEELDTVLCESCFDEATKSANQKRSELVQRYREFVEKYQAVRSVDESHKKGNKTAREHFYETEFFKKGNKVTAVIYHLILGRERVRSSSRVGRAICAPGDVFNEWIGKAIALARALEIDIPEEFLNAVQPDEVVVGMILKFKFKDDDSYKLTHVNKNNYGFYNLRTQRQINDVPYDSILNYFSVIDDTNAEYGTSP